MMHLVLSIVKFRTPQTRAWEQVVHVNLPFDGNYCMILRLVVLVQRPAVPGLPFLNEIKLPWNHHYTH